MTKRAYLCRRRLQCKQMGCSCRKSCRVSPRIDPGSGRGNRSCCSDPDIRPEPRGWSSLSPPGPAWHRSAAESEYNPESPSAWTQCLLQIHRGSTSTSAGRKTSCLISLSKATHAIPIIFLSLTQTTFESIDLNWTTPAKTNAESIHNMQRWMKSKSHHLCDQTWRWRWLIPDYDSNRWKHSASPEDLSQSSYRCFKMTRWWNTLKHKLAGEIFMQLAFLFVSRALADRWLAEIWRAVNLSDSLLVLLHSLTVTGKHFLPFFRAES